jgi:putative hydrolase of the HAD superfamily
MDHLVIFDGDDTLWITEPLYDAARVAAGHVVASVGLNIDAWDRLQREIDVQNVDVLGLSPERFPTSCVQAAERVANLQGETLGDNVRQAIWSSAASVFAQPAPLAPYACQILEHLRPAYHLALLTKGDVRVQQARISESRLEGYFDRIDIVDRKDASTFRTLVDDFRLRAEKAWSVGNSLRSDILPAVKAGLHGVLVDAHVWEFERFERHHVPATVPVLRDLSELQGLLTTPASAEATT